MSTATLPVDPSLVLSQATQSDLVRRKLDMDALRQRLGDQATKDEKLRESCEGFEAIFLQKMWEQMRKNVPKEGYLHSKDEETYQSLFDIELCKKMASAGGIGLADMLYQQLSQQLEDTGRTTTPGSYRRPLDIAASSTLMAAAPAKVAEAAAQSPLKAEDLYSPLPEEPLAEKDGQDPVSGALAELKAGLEAEKESDGEAVREWARARDEATGVIAASVSTGAAVPAGAGAEAGPARPESVGFSTAAAAGAQTQAAGAARPEDAAAAGSDAPRAGKEARATTDDPALRSWQGPGPVSAKPKPLSTFGRNGKTAKIEETSAKTQSEPRGMAPKDTLWPLADPSTPVVSRFGWEDDPASGKRRWNPGVRIAAEPHTPVRAVLAGTVVYAGERDGAGHTVVLEHKEGFRSYYGHLEPGSVKVGDKVRAGAEFAKIAAEPLPPANGENSASLHFELKKGEMALNPESAIARNMTG